MHYKKSKVNYYLITFLIVFSIISIITIKRALIYLPNNLGNLALKQLVWYLLSIIIIIFIYRLREDFFSKYHWVIYGINIILLCLLLLFGEEINGSKCWFTIPYLGSFQPSEFMKISLIITLSYTLNDLKIKYQKASCKNIIIIFFKSFLIVLPPAILTFLEPDTGAVIIYFFSYFILLFILGIPYRFFIAMVSIAIIFLSVFLSFYFFYQDEFISIFGNSFFYRIDRLILWQSGNSFQLENALVAIGTSSLFPLRETPLYFPESGTDFIFAVLASNFGLILTIIFIIIILLFDLYLMKIAKSQNEVQKLIITGFLSSILFSQIQNISMNLGLLPITGITLPFISYGGSSLSANIICISICLNIYKRKPPIKIDG